MMSVSVHGMRPPETYIIHYNPLSDLLQLSEECISSKWSFIVHMARRVQRPVFSYSDTPLK
jgi:hypothetical protein